MFAINSLSRLAVRSCVSATRHDGNLLRAFSAAAKPVTPAMIKELRTLTGAPMMDCKAALDAENGDIQKALDWLRKKGIAAAGKKAGRATAQGLVSIQVSTDGKSASIVELNSETDFVARNENFQTLASKISSAVLAHLSGSSSADKTITGAYNSSAAEKCVEDVSGKDLPGGDTMNTPCSVGDGVTECIAKVRENMVLNRAARLEIDDGLIVSYTHNAVAPNLGAIGVLVSLKNTSGQSLDSNHEKYPELTELGKKVAMHIAAAKPLYLNRNQIPAEALEKEKNILAEQARAQGKSEEIIEKMMVGRMNKFYEDNCLLDQQFILAMDEKIKVGKMVEKTSKTIGVPVEVDGFVHFVVGEAQRE